MHRPSELLMMGRGDDDSPLARFDVRTRVIVALAAMVAVVMSTRPWLPLAVFALCASYWIAARESIRFALGRLAGPLGLAGLVWLWRALTTGGTPVWSLDLGPWRLAATREGLLGGAMIASRVLGSVSVFIILCNTTPAHRLESVLRWARLPRTWLEIAMLMHRYIFILLEQALSVFSAQKLRLGYGSLRRALGSMSNLAGIVMLRSLDQAEKSHQAMVARGYTGTLPIPSLPAMPSRQRRIAWAGVAILAVAFVLAERWLP
jgi:cobalt/nickel transport system permease protein